MDLKLLRQLLELNVDDQLPVALACDDVRLLKRVAMPGDTVLASADAAVADEVAAGRLVVLQLHGVRRCIPTWASCRSRVAAFRR